MTRSLRWGILGTGSIARRFASELPHSKTGRLAAVGSRSAETAKLFAGKFRVARHHGSYEGLLADPQVEAVYIATPHPSHAQWAIAAAAAGKHILCEKPLAMNRAEALAIVEAARRHGVFLMEAFMYRFHPRTQRLLELVKEQAVGPLRLLRASFSFATPFQPQSRLFSKALGGGGILDVGCYTTSITRLVAGAAVGKPFEDPAEIEGTARLCETGVDETAIASLKFPSGLLAQISCALSLQQESELVLYGEKGRIVVPTFWNPPGKMIIHDYASGQSSPIETDPFPHKYALEADAVATALPGQQSPLMPWDDSLGNMRTLDIWRDQAGVFYKTSGDL